MTRDWELAAPADDFTLVALLSVWAARGRQASPEPVVLPRACHDFVCACETCAWTESCLLAVAG